MFYIVESRKIKRGRLTEIGRIRIRKISSRKSIVGRRIKLRVRISLGGKTSRSRTIKIIF